MGRWGEDGELRLAGGMGLRWGDDGGFEDGGWRSEEDGGEESMRSGWWDGGVPRRGGEGDLRRRGRGRIDGREGVGGRDENGIGVNYVYT